MASEPAGITALFSMYNDDDDEEEENELSDPPDRAPSNRASSPRSPLKLSEPSSDRKTLISPRAPTPSQIRSPSSPRALSSGVSPAPEFTHGSGRRIGALGIVDYGHDEMAVSPEHGEGERTSPGTVHMFREDMQISRSPIVDNLQKSKSDASMAVDIAGSDYEMIQAEETGTISADTQNDDMLTRFLGPPLTTKCSEELQQKMNKFLAYKRIGKSFNAEVRNRKDYRNPDFLQHAVRYQDIDQIGTCFSKEVFNPHGYDKSDYYDVIEADMKREQERKEQERKKSPKVDFVSGGIQPPTVIPILKTSLIPSSSALPPAPPTGDAITRESRHKKSKWDKVEADVTNSVPPTGAAAVLTQSAVGGGYSGFAQQKRKEAEDKKANDKKSDKRT